MSGVGVGVSWDGSEGQNRWSVGEAVVQYSVLVKKEMNF